MPVTGFFEETNPTFDPLKLLECYTDGPNTYMEFDFCFESKIKRQMFEEFIWEHNNEVHVEEEDISKFSFVSHRANKKMYRLVFKVEEPDINKAQELYTHLTEKALETIYHKQQ
jgi:hypothetical protein